MKVQNNIVLNSDLGGLSFFEDSTGKYVVGADSVPKKLGSSILYVGSGSSIDIKKLLPNEYSKLTADNFLTEITGSSIGWSKGGRDRTTTPSYSLNKTYDSFAGIYTHNSKVNSWTADVNDIMGGSKWAEGATAHITITTNTYVIY